MCPSVFTFGYFFVPTCTDLCQKLFQEYEVAPFDHVAFSIGF